MLRGEPGSSLKGGEVPMRNENGWGSSKIQDLEDDGDEGLEADFNTLTCWWICVDVPNIKVGNV